MTKFKSKHVEKALDNTLNDFSKAELPSFNRDNLNYIYRENYLDETKFTIAASNFTKSERLGEGTYGVVYKGCDTRTGAVVAIKRVKFVSDDEGIPITSIREITVLRRLKHPNIVRLLNMVTESERIYLVFEYIDMDLSEYLKVPESSLYSHRRRILQPKEIYQILFQIIKAVLYCHERRIIHRDIKPQNILITTSGEVKVADFGLARTFQLPFPPYTHEIVTLYYRAPEVLLCSDMYACGVDVWSIGCIFGEMFLGNILMTGDCEIDQLFQIFKLLGTPNDCVFPGVSNLSAFSFRFPLWSSTIDETMSKTEIDLLGLDCLKNMLLYNTSKRFSALQVYNHPCFKEHIDKSQYSDKLI